MFINKAVLAASVTSMFLLSGCQSYNQLVNQMNHQRNTMNMNGTRPVAVEDAPIDPASLFQDPSSHAAALQHLAMLIKNSAALQSMQTRDGVRLSDLIPQETPIAGIYNVINPRNFAHVFYTDQNLRLSLDRDGWRAIKVGGIQMIDKNTQHIYQRYLFDQLKFDDAIVYRFGNGAKKTLAFTALDCPHSREFFSSLLKSNAHYNATLYVFPNLLNKQNPANNQFLGKIWCSSNSAQQYRSAMLSTNYVAQSTGSSPCDFDKRQGERNMLADIFGVTGSPAFTTESGTFSGFPEHRPEAQTSLLNILLNGQVIVGGRIATDQDKMAIE